MSDTARPKTNGDKLDADEINGDLPTEVTCGETIDTSSVPQAVYVADSDGEAYKTDASFNDERIHNFIGFAIEDGANGVASKVQNHGVVSGFSGLDAGKPYYLSDTAGAISSSRGTNSKMVGIAVSATELLIFRKYVEDRILDKDDSDTALSGTEATIFSFTLPGGSLGADNAIKGKIWFQTTQSSFDHTFRLKIGSTTILTITLDTAFGGAAGTGSGVFEFTMYADDAFDAQSAHGLVHAGHNQGNSGSTSASALYSYGRGTATEDTDGDLTIAGTIEGNVLTAKGYFVELTTGRG